MQVNVERLSARQARRGIKRTCQDEPCGNRFYDLNKTPIACPHCGAAYVPPPEIVLKPMSYGKRPFYKLEKPQPIVVDADEATDLVEDDVVDAGDDGDDKDTESGKTETILEIDDDDSGGDDIAVPGRDDGDNG